MFAVARPFWRSPLGRSLCKVRDMHMRKNPVAASVLMRNLVMAESRARSASTSSGRRLPSPGVAPWALRLTETIA